MGPNKYHRYWKVTEYFVTIESVLGYDWIYDWARKRHEAEGIKGLSMSLRQEKNLVNTKCGKNANSVKHSINHIKDLGLYSKENEK